ncbi:OmpL47-type beta-barrel domain-containing protein [Candidatus Cloacimonadota bacterium]
MKKYSLFLLGILIIGIICAQQTDAEDVTSQESSGFYRGLDGRLFVAQSMPIFLQISTSPDGSGAQALQNEMNQAMQLPEGKNLIKNPNAVFIAEDGTEHSATLEVWADGTPPKVTASFENAERYETDGVIYFGSNLHFSLTSEDALSGVKETFISVNEQPFQSYSSVNLNMSVDGNYLLKYYSVDNVGNESEIKESKFIVDITPPRSSIKITGPKQQNILSPLSSIELKSMDNSSGNKKLFYTFNDAEMLEYKAPLILNELEDREHQLSFYAVDNVSNQETIQTFTFFLDSTPPELDITVSGNLFEDDRTTYVSGSVTAKLSGTDNRAGIPKIYYHLNSESDQPYPGIITIPAKSGLQQIYFSATDFVGNKSEEYIKKVYVDLTPPESTHEFAGSVLSLGDTILINSDTEIKLSASDMEAGIQNIQYKFNGDAVKHYDQAIHLEEEGFYRLQYFAADRVKNVESAHTVLIKVDNSPRRPVTTAPPTEQPKKWKPEEENVLVGSTELPFYVRIATGPEEDAESFLIDLSSVQTKDSKPLYFDKEGKNKLIIKIAGSKKSYSIPIDGKAPKTKVEFLDAERSKQNDIIYYGPNLTATLSAADQKSTVMAGLDKIYFSIDGSQFGLYKDPLLLFANEKDYEFRFYAVDLVGNAEKVQQYNFTVDITSPRTQLSIDGSNYGNMLSPQSIISLIPTDHLSGVKETFYQFDDLKTLTYTGIITGNKFSKLSNGEHLLHYYSVDQVGNVENEKTFTFHFDQDPPAVALKILGDVYETKSSIFISSRTRIELTAEEKDNEVKNILYAIDNGKQLTYSDPIVINQKEGYHTIRYRSTDFVDNKSPQQTKTVNLDLTAPQTNFHFEGAYYFNGKKEFIGPDTNIILNAADNKSGVKQIRYQVDSRNWNTFTQAIKLKQLGNHKLTYYAKDQVNNDESRKTRTFFVDSAKPVIQINTSNQTGNQLPANATIYLSASDEHTGIERITYSINGTGELLYRAPISGFKQGDTMEIMVRAWDRVGNLTQKKVVYSIVAEK